MAPPWDSTSAKWRIGAGRQAAEEEAAALRATDRQILEDADH
jgi:hypothetical protein